ncbi:DNA polymerase III subunit gamma/tau, partial [Candidatus Daviesbacteria bacterium]|nr:DNA polymerase III subunit gamma/tau [Candidatus Daviesbacteria bacterium]
MVFYLKYRPQTLDDLIGQEQVKSSLTKAFESNHLAHAYLFCGPRGTGKTSTARILAKMVNCEILDDSDKTKSFKKSPIAESSITTSVSIPCNKCSSCISITDGSNLDLIEIDAASNRGIDDIRDLKEKIKLAPSSARKKVYIIDEVHMLSAEAFNALLKTLEEPPEHVLFILATTELHKIPETILSRVTKLDFKTASTLDLVKALKKVVDGEK